LISFRGIVSLGRSVPQNFKLPAVDLLTLDTTLDLERRAIVYCYPIRTPEDWSDLGGNQPDSDFVVGENVALKRIKPPKKNAEARILHAMQREIQILTNEKFRNFQYIVQLRGLLWEDRKDGDLVWPTMVVEYCHCTLRELLSAHTLDTRLKCEFYYAIQLALQTIMGHDFVHGDIKCENVMIQHSADGSLIPKLSDFGNSVQLFTNSTIQLYGTDPWRAPEVGDVEFRGNLSL
jgi:serine/threonine protein kinase